MSMLFLTQFFDKKKISPRTEIFWWDNCPPDCRPPVGVAPVEGAVVPMGSSCPYHDAKTVALAGYQPWTLSLVSNITASSPDL